MLAKAEIRIAKKKTKNSEKCSIKYLACVPPTIYIVINFKIKKGDLR